MPLDSPGLPKRLEDGIRTIVDGFDAQCAERELKAEQATREQAMKVQAAKHDAEVCGADGREYDEAPGSPGTQTVPRP